MIRAEKKKKKKSPRIQSVQSNNNNPLQPKRQAHGTGTGWGSAQSSKHQTLSHCQSRCGGSFIKPKMKQGVEKGCAFDLYSIEIGDQGRHCTGTVSLNNAGHLCLQRVNTAVTWKRSTKESKTHMLASRTHTPSPNW